eukprot:SAG25_NODE_253_length_10959_cov_17.097330_2_plen_138_part_00
MTYVSNVLPVLVPAKLPRAVVGQSYLPTHKKPHTQHSLNQTTFYPRKYPPPRQYPPAQTTFPSPDHILRPDHILPMQEYDHPEPEAERGAAATSARQRVVIHTAAGPAMLPECTASKCGSWHSHTTKFQRLPLQLLS